MEDIKVKDLCGQWKMVLISTAKFIWKWTVIISKFIWEKTVQFSQWLWSELNKFAKGATWITLLIFSMLVISFFDIIVMTDKHSMAVSSYVAQVNLLNAKIDSLEVSNITDHLMMKAGEYAITAHHETTKITKDSAASLLVNLGAWYPDIILAQIQTESGFGSSDVAHNSNNVLGMKKTNSRKTTQIKNTDYKGYGKYTNWESCVIDRVMWDYEVFGSKKLSRNVYIEKLNAIYGEAEGYGYLMDGYSKKYMKFL